MALSRGKILRTLKADSFETVQAVESTADPMARLLGIHQDCLCMADWGRILIWDKNLLKLRETFEFPTGYYITGVLLADGVLYGSDYKSVFSLRI